MLRIWFHHRATDPEHTESPIRVYREKDRVSTKEETPFMESSHISALQLKHAGIDRQLHDEMSRPLPDAVVIQTLKKRKLRLKEEIGRF